MPRSFNEDGHNDNSSGSEGNNQDLDVSEPEYFAGVASRPRKGKARVSSVQDQPNLIVQTAFDAYFTQTASRAQTSANVFSALVPPLTAQEYSEAISDPTFLGPVSLQAGILYEASLKLIFSRFLRELAEGFNLLVYGFGSKRRVLNKFAVDHCSKAGFVVVANGFQPHFTFKDLLNSIENVPHITSLELSSATVEAQARRIYDFFAQSAPKHHLYIVIHNIDAAPFRSAKAKSCLSLLALHHCIHIIASIDHINAPLLWSTSEISARKPENATSGGTPPRGFAWLWHDLTTLASYDFELAHIDRSSISGAHGGGTRKKNDELAAQNAIAMSETAALHILASVTQKAKRLFMLMGARQLETIEEAGDAPSNDLQQFAISYDILFNTARDNFIATNDTALRSLLGEFRDHSLVVTTQATSGGEILWIPLRKERLASVLHSIQTDQ